MRTFNESLPMLLLRARESTMGFFRPILNQYGLSEQQWRAIRALYETPGISASDLADVSMILSPSLTRILSKLERDGLLKREKVSSDLRKQKIMLTSKGDKLFITLAPLVERQYADIRGSMNSERLDTLYELLAELVQINERQGGAQ